MRLVKIVLILLFCGAAVAQNDFSFTTYDEFETALGTAIDNGELDNFWESIVAAGKMPLTFDTLAVFMYRGEGEIIEWRGDFSGWEPSPDYQGVRVSSRSDIWIMVAEFPTYARLDYKIVIDDTTWILDPLNPYEQWGGFGPNSELRMPDYVYPAFTIARDEVPKGELSSDITITSEYLDYAVNYRVYTPADYDQLDDLPVIYVTDGQEYADELLGSMVITLDNLIADAVIHPVIAVFVDPREPGNPMNNRRENEYSANPEFSDFLANELVPQIDATYKTAAESDQRVILGTSVGGLNAAFVGLNHSNVFGLVAIQSPAFWMGPMVLDAYKAAPTLPLNIFLSQGTIWDDNANIIKFRDTLKAKDYDLHYVEIPEGHSWGNWRALLDDMLIYFFGIVQES